jgi:dTDP-D-glucose 4,6-dehydratase
MTILITGGAGFIGSNFVLDWLAGSSEPVVNLDKLIRAVFDQRGSRFTNVCGQS